MRLINVNNLEFEEVSDETTVKYAILSHRWEDEEVLYLHMTKRRLRQQISRMKGFHKIYTCCQQAARDGYRYAWVDTCCIDKSSSAELQEAINSMYRWYAGAGVCYAYLSDVRNTSSETEFIQSKWFERGWTLQELLAPKKLIFFDSFWRVIGSRGDVRRWVFKATRIPAVILEKGFNDATRPCIADILSWAAHRKTTRIEDRAYSLMGLFGVSMPMLYGEGDRAFQRLQEEIFKETEDQTILAWTTGIPDRYGALRTLATSPDQFGSLGIAEYSGAPLYFMPSNGVNRRRPHSITNEGISLELDLMPLMPRVYAAFLNLDATDHDNRHKIGFFVQRLDKENRFIRVSGKDYAWNHDLASVAYMATRIVYKRRQITIVRRPQLSESMDIRNDKSNVFRLADLPQQELYDSAIDSAYRMEGITTQVQDGVYNPKTKLWTAALKVRKHHVSFPQPGITGKLGIYRRLWRYQKHQTVFFGFDFDYCPACIICTQDELPSTTILDEIIFASSGFKTGSDTLSAMSVEVDRGGVWQPFRDDMLLIKATMASTDNCDGFSGTVSLHDATSTKLSITLRRDGVTQPWDVHMYLESKLDNINEEAGDMNTWQRAVPVGDLSEQLANLSTSPTRRRYT